MSSRLLISRKLKEYGCVLVRETGSYDRFQSPFGAGSLYVKDNYISATGNNKILEDRVSRSSSDSKGCPEWRDSRVNEILIVLKELIE